MRSCRTVLWLLVLAVSATALAQVLPREVRARILEAVVELAPYDDEAGRYVGTGGSGTIISPEGHILTNFHVIGDELTGSHYTWHAVLVTDPSHPDRATEHRYWARFVAGDPHHDLAIVKIELHADESPVAAGTTFPAMAIGDSNSLLPGDPITIVGYPGIGGFTVTVTTGIVSGWLGEDLESGGKQWVKTDARIAGGNSGGGAFDEHGSLVAIPTSRLQTNERGFEEQNLLRPVALALPLVAAHVPNAERAGGVAALSVPGAMPQAEARASTGPPGSSVGSIRGTLGPGDETLASGEYFDLHERDFTAGTTVVITLRSTDFDPYLVVFDPDGELVLEVDDSPDEGLDVKEALVPLRSGSYGIVVTSAFSGETGAYELTIGGDAPATATTPATPPPPEPPAQGFAAAPAVDGATAARALDPSSGSVGAVPIGARVSGRLAGSDGATYHTYVVDVPPGTSAVTFALRADADLDLFAKFGSDIVDWGEAGDWDHRDISVEPSATLTVPAPRPGRWYVDVVFLQGAPLTAGYTFEVR
jgi:hypothetical protein